MHQHLSKVEDETRANCAKTVQKKTKRTNKPGRVEEELSLASDTGINTFLFINWLSSVGEAGPGEKVPTKKKKERNVFVISFFINVWDYSCIIFLTFSFSFLHLHLDVQSFLFLSYFKGSGPIHKP